VHFNSVEFAQKMRALLSFAHRGSRQEIYEILGDLNIGFQMPTFKDVPENEDVAATVLDVAPRQPWIGPLRQAVIPMGEKAS
jgi:hypothetical protein